MDAGISVAELATDGCPRSWSSAAGRSTCRRTRPRPGRLVDDALAAGRRRPARCGVLGAVPGGEAGRRADRLAVRRPSPARARGPGRRRAAAQRRRGVGAGPAGRAERALAELGAAEVLLAGNPPHYAWPGIDVRYTPAVCLALALGYRQDRTAWNMTADLSYDGSPALRPTEAAESRLAGQGVTVRRAEPADLPALAAFARVDVRRHVGRRIGRLGGSPGRRLPPGRTGRRGARLRRVRVVAAELVRADGHRARRRGFGHRRGVCCAVACATSGRQESTAAQIGWVGPVPFYSGSAGARIERVFFLYRRRLTLKAGE